MEGNVCVAQVDFALCKLLVNSRTHLLFRYRGMLCILLSASLFACKPVVEVNDNFIVVQLDFAMLYLLVHSRTLVVQVKGNICLDQLEFALSKPLVCFHSHFLFE